VRVVAQNTSKRGEEFFQGPRISIFHFLDTDFGYYSSHPAQVGGGRKQRLEPSKTRGNFLVIHDFTNFNNDWNTRY
jgi:hypothetical protein